jgi:hypothetical protein
MKALGTLGKLGVGILEGVIEGAIKGLVNCMGAERLDMFIENNWSILEALMKAMKKPDYPKELSKEEIERLESFRGNLVRVVLPALGMAKTFASKLPEELIVEKLNADWLMKRAEQKFPLLAERIKAHGDKGRAWLEKQAEEIALFLTGRLVWDGEKFKVVHKGRHKQDNRQRDASPGKAASVL